MDTCPGTDELPRTMGGKEEPDGTVTGLCVWCQQFRKMYEVIPPSHPTWKREFRLAAHEES